MTAYDFERLIDQRRAAEETMLGKAWDYAKVRWAYHMAKYAEAHEWLEDGTCECHGYTPLHIMDLVIA